MAAKLGSRLVDQVAQAGLPGYLLLWELLLLLLNLLLSVLRATVLGYIVARVFSWL